MVCLISPLLVPCLTLLLDIINIVTIVIFGVEHRFDDGFTYGQAFWMTVSSTAVSSVTNLILITDFIMTPDFAHSGTQFSMQFCKHRLTQYTGSGLTRKQRSLVIVVIVLLVYIAFGALINSLLMNLTFINGLYFTVVTIETIGFGDIVPESTGSRVFICFYLAFGILNIGIAVAMCRETVLEGLEIGYRKRLRKMRKRRREARRFRKWETRWKRAIIWRLKEKGLPIWVDDTHYTHEGMKFTGIPGIHDQEGEENRMRRWLEGMGLVSTRLPTDDERRHVRGHPRNKHLNIDALSAQQLEAAALEAGVPLEMFTDPSGRPTMKRHESDESTAPNGSQPQPQPQPSSPHAEHGRPLHHVPSSSGWPSHPQTPTHAQIGRMAAMITQVAVAATGGHIRLLSPHTEPAPDLTKDKGKSSDTGGDTEPTETQSDDAADPTAKKGSAVWFDDSIPTPKRDPQQRGEGSNGSGSEQCHDGGLVDVGMHAPVPKWARELARSVNERSAFSYEQYKEELAAEEKKATFAKVSEVLTCNLTSLMTYISLSWHGLCSWCSGL